MDVERSVLKGVEVWQKAAVAELEQHPELAASERSKIAADLITVVLCLFLCEQRHWLDLQRNVISLQGLSEYWQQLQIRFGRQSGHPFSAFQIPARSLQVPILSDMIETLSGLPQPLPIEILGQAYEKMLAARGGCGKATADSAQLRKANGVYYTPKPIVDYMVRHTIDRVAPLPTIVDPACGSGAFLLAAYQYLLDRHLHDYQTDRLSVSSSVLQQTSTGDWQLSLTERQRVLQAIHGVDIDPQAVAITQLSLWLKLLETVEVPDQVHADVRPIVHNIRVGNAVIETAGSLDWQSAFPDIFASGGFDLVLGNPPYVDAELMTVHLPDWRRYCNRHYQTAEGNWDLFCIFVEKALQLCRSGGLSSLIVPNQLLSAQYARATRALLAQTSHIQSIRDYSRVPVFAASVYPVVYIAQKHAPVATTIYEQMRTLDQVQQRYPVMLHQTPKAAARWSICLRSHADLVQRLDQTLPKLGALLKVTGAATVAEAYQLSPLLQNSAMPHTEDLSVVNSGTIDRYCFLWGQKPLRYLGQSYQYPIVAKAKLSGLPAKRLWQATHPKIVVAGMAKRLECALDAVGSVLAGKSTSVIQVAPAAPSTEPSIDLYYLLGLLNSRLISFYFSREYGNNRLQGGYMRVGPPQLRQLPIVMPNSGTPSSDYQRLLDLIQQRLTLQQQANGDIQTVEQQIDQTVYALYQLTDAEIEMVQSTQ